MRKETSEPTPCFYFSTNNIADQMSLGGKCDAAMLIRARHFSAAALLMLVAGVQTQPSLTQSSQSICAVTGSTINIPCTSQYGFRQIQWYRVQSSKGEPQDLREDPQYSGRVSVRTWWSDCSLTIRDVKVSDSGVYTFRIETWSNSWISVSTGIHLTVTDLQVKVDQNTVGQNEMKLSCSSTCTLNTLFYWFKDERYKEFTKDASIVLDLTRPSAKGIYSCQVPESFHRSPSVCVLDKACWGVSYTPDHVCALKDTSINLSCSYKHPADLTVIKSVWFIKETVDVTEDEEYQGRVLYIQKSENDCSLRIINLTERDAQTYRFRFYTNGRNYDGEPGVTLSVTDLKVRVSDWYRGKKKLSCITTCTLSNNPIYIWYKNGQRITNRDRNELLVSNLEAGSCAVGRHEEICSPAVYSPKNTRAVVLPSGDTVEGDSVTLRCSSDANPPVLTFTWFKQTAAADTLLITGQNYSITNIRTNHSGLYYCTAHNLLGQNTSTVIHLNVLYSPKNTRAVVLPSGDTVEGDSVTLSCSSDANPPVLNFTWFKQTAAADTLLTTGQNYSITNIRTDHSGLYYCTAHNLLGHHNSTLIHLDVFYPPRNPSVTVIPSMSVDLVILLCTSDSNPTSSYTWYKKTEQDVMLVGNGTNLTLSSGEDGFYYCTAMNRFGSSNSSKWTNTSDNRVAKNAASGFTVALVLSFIGILLWMRYFNKQRPSAVSIRSAEDRRNDSAPVYSNTSAMTSSEDQDNVQYTSVYFRQSHTKDVPLYSTVQLPKARNQNVEYATVSLVTPRTVREDEIYSNLKSKE